jgi:hypothetical protein
MQRALVLAVAGSLLAATSFAQAPPQPAAPSAPPAAKPKVKKATTAPQTPEGIECSKQADAKGLHGQERIRFRANCKKKLMKQKT